MPLYTVTCNGSLITKSGPVAHGRDVEMSEAEASSLPPGTVARKAPAEVVNPPAPAVPESPPAPPPIPAVEAPRGRKGNKS